MSKSTKVIKVGNVLTTIKVPTKLRIGGRKSGKSAHSMSNVQLNAICNDRQQRRWHYAAKTVLASRLK